MKDYLARLKACPKKNYIIWWVFRVGMLIMLISSFFQEPFDPIMPLEILLNLGCMFVWELCMAMPKWTIFRYISPSLQTVITVLDFICVVAGYAFDFYYTVRLWDSALHFAFGVLLIFLGYEMTCTLIKKEQKNASITLVIIASVGFCVMCTTLWEIFEFSCDQLVGMTTGVPHDVQHWSFALAEGTPKENTIFESYVAERFALMDTMGDIVLNTLGSIIATVILIIYPYHHKGRFRLVLEGEGEEKVKKERTK